ncbi:hypothetical protein BRADI_1g68435v3 [Brachypodium distachyon]|uniref:Uncharacterized protein n=1 Tax=Brachypodium distachyon TaxID=15368 RepID=A0A2K2DU10_BRADI|nr:hypothetical protein BRADI_1g68435v3 [Brachypodium distachyon]
MEGETGREGGLLMAVVTVGAQPLGIKDVQVDAYRIRLAKRSATPRASKPSIFHPSTGWRGREGRKEDRRCCVCSCWLSGVYVRDRFLPALTMHGPRCCATHHQLIRL